MNAVAEGIGRSRLIQGAKEVARSSKRVQLSSNESEYEKATLNFEKDCIQAHLHLRFLLIAKRSQIERVSIKT